MSIDYERMRRVYPKQKAALTRAVKTKDRAKIVAVAKKAMIEWDEIGAWPDDWHRWMAAVNDAGHWSEYIFDLRDLED